jgi:hypothetical protein
MLSIRANLTKPSKAFEHMAEAMCSNVRVSKLGHTHLKLGLDARLRVVEGKGSILKVQTSMDGRIFVFSK